MARRGENIYKRKDGRYEGRYIKGRRVDGKTLFGYIYGYAYQEVKTLLAYAKVTAAGERGRAPCIVGDGSLSDFLYYWLEYIVKDNVKPSTFAQYTERMRKHINPALGTVNMRSLTKEQAQNFIDSLNNKGLSPWTVAGIARLLRSALKKARELRLIAENPCENLVLPQPEKKENPVLERSEQIKLEWLAGKAGRDVEISIFIALYAGLRIGEVCALRWSDVDFFNGTITVLRTLQRIKIFENGTSRTVLFEGTPKSRQSTRRIPIPAGIMDKLYHYGANASGDSYVLTGGATPVEPRRVSARFKKLVEEAGLSITFHTLRHTYATRCLEHNFDIQTLSELLGHANANITMSVYAHSVLGHKKLLCDRISVLSENYKPSNKQSEATIYN